MIAYDFGPGHPLAPVRLDLTMRLARELGVLDRSGVTVVAPEPADDALLGLVHDPRYVAAVAVECGLEQVECSEVSYRAEGGEPVGSTLVCLRRAELAH